MIAVLGSIMLALLSLAFLVCAGFLFWLGFTDRDAETELKRIWQARWKR